MTRDPFITPQPGENYGPCLRQRSHPQARNGPHCIHFKGRMGAKIKPRSGALRGLCWLHEQLPCPSMEPREEALAGWGGHTQKSLGGRRFPSPSPAREFGLTQGSAEPTGRGYSREERSSGSGSKPQWQPQGQVEADKCCTAESSGPGRNHHLAPAGEL